MITSVGAVTNAELMARHNPGMARLMEQENNRDFFSQLEYIVSLLEKLTSPQDM